MFSENDDPIVRLLPTKEGSPSKQLLKILENSQLLFQKSFCFREAMSSLVQSIGGEYIQMIRVLQNSDMALLISLLRSESENTGSTYKITVSIFNYARGCNQAAVNSVLKERIPFRYAECKDLLVLELTKPLLHGFTQLFIKFLTNRYCWTPEQEELWQQLEQLEKMMAQQTKQESNTTRSK